jgi:hypothetical protein
MWAIGLQKRNLHQQPGGDYQVGRALVNIPMGTANWLTLPAHFSADADQVLVERFVQLCFPDAPPG